LIEHPAAVAAPSPVRRQCRRSGDGDSSERANPPPSPHAGPSIRVRRLPFPPVVIVVAVRWYLRFGLSYRDVEELLADRGIEVDHVTVDRWVQRFTPLLAEAARTCRHPVGDRWQVDETDVKVADSWRDAYRAMTSSGRSTTCSCPRAATPPQPAGSSSRPLAPP
jgi:hypothetical protein